MMKFDDSHNKNQVTLIAKVLAAVVVIFFATTVFLWLKSKFQPPPPATPEDPNLPASPLTPELVPPTPEGAS